MEIVNGKKFNGLLMVTMISMIFVAAMTAMAIPTVKAPLPPNTMYVYPEYSEVLVCTNFYITVYLSTTTYPTPVASFNLTFDPTLMECKDVVLGSSLPPIIFSNIEYDNTMGYVNVSLITQTEFSGPIAIAEITFHCKDVGTSFLNFTSAMFGTGPISSVNGTCTQLLVQQPPVGGEVLTIDALALLMPWIAAAGAVVAATLMVMALTSRKAFKY